MLLRRLVDYAHRLEGPPGNPRNPIPPTGYMNAPIKWIIHLDGEGGFMPPLIPTQGKGTRGKEYACPHRLRTSTSIRPKLLADNAEYVLGVPKGDSEKKERRARDCHAAFVDLVAECAQRTGDPAVIAVRKFLDRMKSPPPLPDDFDASQAFTFRVGEVLPIDLPSVREFWARYFWERVFGGESGDEGEAEEEKGPSDSPPGQQRGPEAPYPAILEMQCIVCGKVRRPVPRHPFQIKGLPGRRAGAAIISANVSAFASYGLAESLIAPTCKDCAEAYAKAANLLIAGESTSVTAGPCAYIFWTKEDREFSPALLLSEPDTGEVKALIRSATTAKRGAVTVDETPFYASALTANQGRVVVRDWLETTIADAKKNLARWFLLQEVVPEFGDGDSPPIPLKGYRRASNKRWVEGLAECTVPKVKRRRDVTKANPASPAALLRVALKGGRLPAWFLAEAVKRNVAERDVTRPRAALIKMVLLSQAKEALPEDTMIKLDPDNPDGGYQCGRLLAVLESVQYAAQGKLNATVTDRFFGTASSAPATVFGTLLRRAKTHLAKVRKEKPGLCVVLEREVEDVTAHLAAFPRTLTLEQQGLFGLGYYHQRAARAAAVAAKQSKETAEVNGEDTDETEGRTDD